MLLSIRVTTERTMTTRTRALEAVNQRLEELDRTAPLVQVAALARCRV